VKSHNPTLTHLELTNRPGYCSNDAYMAILAAAVRHTVLTTLILQQGLFAPNQPLADFIARNRAVTHFSMGQPMYSTGYFWMRHGELLPKFRTLTKLDLSHCGLYDTQVVDVSRGLVHSAVRVLNLAENHIANASPLVNCTTLTEIDLTSNKIDNDGAIKLSTMAPRLERLKVNRCHIGVRGFRSLLAAPFRTLFCEMLKLVEKSLVEDRELFQGMIELLPTATMRSLAISVERDVRDIECTKDQELRILQALTKNKSLVAYNDRNTWFHTCSSRRTVRHICLRNSVDLYSTALVPAAFASLLCKSTGANLVYRMLCDHPDWITRKVVVVGQRQHHRRQHHRSSSQPSCTSADE
jgi:Leucine Rich repeat